MTQVKKSQLSRLANQAFELSFNIPWEAIDKTYQAELAKAAENATLKGFRKGKAPVELVEKQVNQPALYQNALKSLLPKYYTEAIKEHDLKPVANPKIDTLKSEAKEDWQFKATSCELPQVQVDGFETIVKEAATPEQLWTPGSGGEKLDEKKAQSQKLGLIFKALLEKIKLDLPEILIEQESGRLLSRLLAQINRLGLVLDQYLASINKTAEQLQADYKKQAEDSLRLELILQTIGQAKNITVAQEEVDKVIQAAPDEKTRQAFQTPLQQAYLNANLRKQKVIDYLLAL
ncbi:hypothetical protein KKD62_03505 [Patescibacteria group bacterium]|nr:hypothetical protein [Patescibacteria group bacterium]MBU1931868.1 hypothetical protein [Patescibacteria group bacterium]